MHGFVQDRGLLQTIPGEVDVVAGSQVRAGGHNASIVGVEAILDGAGLNVHVPTIHEITVEAVAGGIAIGEDELTSARLIDEVGPVQYPASRQLMVLVAAFPTHSKNRPGIGTG
jgi:hypothetical protein